VATDIEIWQAIVLGVVEGLTEFLPISSTGHLTILESAFGLQVDSPDVTAFTAIIQVGAVLATLLFFRAEFTRIVLAGARGLVRPAERRSRDFHFAIAVVAGCIPIGLVGLAFQDTIETTLRSLWFVGAALVLWSFPMAYADRHATQVRGEDDVTLKDTLVVGVVQCLALIPGVSRSGATMSAGLLRGLDRVSVTRLSFFLSVPVLVAAGALQIVTKAGDISDGVGWGPTILATAVSFVVAYFAVAWLLRYIARHDYTLFIRYRIVLGTLILVLVGTGALSAT
jgi:undecaprenyl-diphosphatase